MKAAFDNLLKFAHQWEHLGKQVYPNATLIGKAPHIAPMAWLHQFYSPLTEEEILEIESKTKVAYPESFKSFLLLTNGLLLFNTKFSIYGTRKNYSRDISNTAIWQPFSIFDSNIHERISNAQCKLTRNLSQSKIDIFAHIS